MLRQDELINLIEEAKGVVIEHDEIVDALLFHPDRVVHLCRRLQKRSVKQAVALLAVCASGTVVDGLTSIGWRTPSTRCCIDNVRFAKRVLAGKTRFEPFVEVEEYVWPD